MKLIVNMVMGSVVASLAEAMAMAEKVGLDQEDVAEVLTLGSLNCPTIAHKSQGKKYNGLLFTPTKPYNAQPLMNLEKQLPQEENRNLGNVMQ